MTRVSDDELEDLLAFVRRYPCARPRSRIRGLERALDELSRARAVLKELPPIARGTSVTLPRDLYEKVRGLAS